MRYAPGDGDIRVYRTTACMNRWMKNSRKLKIIRSSSRHLEKIINDILDFSKLQDGKVVLEEMHFSINQDSTEEVCMPCLMTRPGKTTLF
jgi:signal transduction histidine kinase